MGTIQDPHSLYSFTGGGGGSGGHVLSSYFQGRVPPQVTLPTALWPLRGNSWLYRVANSSKTPEHQIVLKWGEWAVTPLLLMLCHMT